MSVNEDREALILLQLREKLKPIPFNPIPPTDNLNGDDKDLSNSVVFSTEIHPSVNDILTDADCNRFLHARNYHIEKAVDMIKGWAIWYVTPLQGSDITPSNIDPIVDPNESIYTEYMPHSNLGHDKVGRPVYWEKTGYISTRFSEIKKKLSEDEIVIRHVKQQELMMQRRFKANSKNFGKLINKQVLIFDLKGVSFSPDVMAMRCFHRTLKIDEAFYPETLHCLYMINTPIFFSAIWAIIRPWIHPETVKKIRLLGTNYLPELLEGIDIDQIPAEYGGENHNFHWTFPDNLPDNMEEITY